MKIIILSICGLPNSFSGIDKAVRNGKTDPIDISSKIVEINIRIATAIN
jgi:hypothetical protein